MNKLFTIMCLIMCGCVKAAVGKEVVGDGCDHVSPPSYTSSCSEGSKDIQPQFYLRCIFKYTDYSSDSIPNCEEFNPNEIRIHLKDSLNSEILNSARNGKSKLPSREDGLSLELALKEIIMNEIGYKPSNNFVIHVRYIKIMPFIYISSTEIKIPIQCCVYATQTKPIELPTQLKETRLRFSVDPQCLEYDPSNDVLNLLQIIPNDICSDPDLTNELMSILQFNGDNIDDPYANDRSSCDFLKDPKSDESNDNTFGPIVNITGEIFIDADESDDNRTVCPSDTPNFDSGDESYEENQYSNIQRPKFIL